MTPGMVETRMVPLPLSFRALFTALVFVVVVVVCSCGTAPAVCSGRNSQGISFCSEFTGLTDEQRTNTASGCTAQGGTSRVGTCDTRGAVAGCRGTVSNYTVTSWYYGNVATSDVQSLCSLQGFVYVTP